ncbi:MAG: envelope stress response membrane protein PspB [Sphingorhabdus sp.]
MIIVPVVMGILFIGLPWLILHHVTKWKTAATLTNDDERMLSDMHTLANRLEERLDTVERLVSEDNPNWQPRRIDHEDNEYVEEFLTESSRKLERKS